MSEIDKAQAELDRLCAVIEEAKLGGLQLPGMSQEWIDRLRDRFQRMSDYSFKYSDVNYECGCDDCEDDDAEPAECTCWECVDYQAEWEREAKRRGWS